MPKTTIQAAPAQSIELDRIQEGLDRANLNLAFLMIMVILLHVHNLVRPR